MEMSSSFFVCLLLCFFFMQKYNESHVLVGEMSKIFARVAASNQQRAIKQRSLQVPASAVESAVIDTLINNYSVMRKHARIKIKL